MAFRLIYHLESRRNPGENTAVPPLHSEMNPMRSGNLNWSRREALAALGLAALSCRTTLAATENPNAATGKKGFALQLYTLRAAAKQDLPGTLKKAREIGFEYVQWSGMPNCRPTRSARPSTRPA